MANVYENELYGDLLPDVFIDKITLENSGYVAVEQNPHIDNEREEVKQEVQSEAMLTTLHITIKEKYENDVVGKWLSEIDFQKYMKIKIIEVEDARFANLMRLTKDVAMALDPATFSSAKKAVKRTMAGYLRKSEEQILELVKSKSHVRSIPIFNDNNQDVDVKKQTSIETLDDGTKILNTHFTQTFQKPKSNMGHLSYYCISYLDHLALIRDFNLEATDELVDFLANSSKVTGEIVFDNFKINNQTTVLVDQDSKIWTGDVHQDDEGQYRSGLEETEDSFPLTRRIISDSTIQDFRRRQKLERVKFDFNPVKKYFEKFEQKNSLTNTNFLTKKNSYFGKINISVDSDREAKIEFSVALKNLLFGTSKFSYLITDHDSKLADEIARAATVRSIKMFRQRVKIQKANNSGITIAKKYVKFSDKEAAKMLFHVKGLSTTLETDEVYFRQVENNLYPNVVQYTGIDKTAPELTDGLYRYSLEMEVEDPFAGYLEETVGNLQALREELEIYRIESEKLSLSKYFTEVSNPHIDSPKEQDMIGTIIEGNYNILTNSFTETFVSKMAERYTNIVDAPWITGISYYVDTLSIFVDSIDDEKKTELQKELQKFASPATGSPSGIALVIALFDQLISGITNILGAESVRDGNSKSTSASKAAKTFLVQHSFENEVFDSNLKQQAIVEYFDTEEPQESKAGLRRLTFDDFKSRMDREVEKFYNSKNAEIVSSIDRGQISKVDTRRTIYSYLSPSMMRIGREKIEIAPTTDPESKRRINNAFSYAKSENKNFYKKDLVEEDLDLSIFNQDLQEKYSVTISGITIDVPEPQPVEETPRHEPVRETEEDKKEKTGKRAARRITDLRGMPEVDKKGVREFISTFGPKANKKTTIFDIEATKSNIANRLSDQEKNRLPIQATSIFAGDSNKDTKKGIIPPKNLKDINYSENQEIANLGSLKEIQILSGYEKGENNEILINNPKWETMTEEKVSSLPMGTEVTCRLADFKDKEIRVEDVTKSAVTADTTFTIVGTARPIQLEPEKEKYNAKVGSKNIQISKQTINQGVKTEVEQNKFPAPLTNSAQVSSVTIEKAVTSKKVKKATEEKQKKVVKSSKSVPKVSTKKTTKKTKKRSKRSIKKR